MELPLKQTLAMQHDPLILAERAVLVWIRGRKGVREMLCLLLGTHSGKTCDFLFRKVKKFYQFSICKWAGKDKIRVMKFLAWRHQLITNGDARQEFISRWLPEEHRADADTILECLVFPETKVASQRLDTAVQGVFTPQLHPTSASWVAKAKQAQQVLPEPAWACQRHLELSFVSAVLLLSSAQSGWFSLCFWSQIALASCGIVLPQPRG